MHLMSDFVRGSGDYLISYSSPVPDPKNVTLTQPMCQSLAKGTSMMLMISEIAKPVISAMDEEHSTGMR